MVKSGLPMTVNSSDAKPLFASQMTDARFIRADHFVHASAKLKEPDGQSFSGDTMSENSYPIAGAAAQVAPRTKPSNYPEPFASQMKGRKKRPLGDLFGLTNFGVNLTCLPPSTTSALRHAHSRQEEFVYILEGRPVLVTDAGKTQLAPGMCAGFKAGTGNGHKLINTTEHDVWYLEIGDRTPGDICTYPDDDLQAALVNRVYQFAHKDGRPY